MARVGTVEVTITKVLDSEAPETGGESGAFILRAGEGAFIMNGGAAAFRTLWGDFGADSGSFSVGGGVVVFKSDYQPFDADPGSFLLIGNAQAMSMEYTLEASGGVYTLIGHDAQFFGELAPTVDLNHVTFANDARIDEFTLETPGALKLWNTDAGRGAMVLRANANGSATRAYLSWNDMHANGVYRFLVSLQGAQPSSSIRRGPLPFARASIDEAGVLQDGYLTGPGLVSGATDRYNLLRADDGVETQIITENVNRNGSWGSWRWVEIKVSGNQISHRTYAEGTLAGSEPAWQTVTDNTYPTGGLHGIGYQQGASSASGQPNPNVLYIAEAIFVPDTPAMTNVIIGNLAMWTGTPPTTNSIVNNKAVYTI